MPHPVAVVLFVLAFAVHLPAHRPPDRAAPLGPPNLLIIVADDIGVDYIGAYGEGTSPPPTPNIDGLARRGVLFRNAWATPSCSPARACILTGRYPFRTYIGRWISWGSNTGQTGTLAAREWTLPEVLDRARSGYSHACVGKWHLNGTWEGLDAPRQIGGFSHFAGSFGGQIQSYTNWTRVEDGAAAVTTDYCTTRNTDDALAWIGRQTGPWVLYLAYQAAHIPYHEPPAHLHTQNLTGLTPKPFHTPANRPFYRAMVESLDTEIGRLFKQLGSTVLSQTNIVFLSDNGTVEQQSVAPFDPNRSKLTPYEGGINVPLIVAGPAVVSGGREVQALTCAVDVFATALELCGARAALPAHVVHDSVSLVPYLGDPTKAPLRSFAFSEQFQGEAWPRPNDNGQAIVRDARFKLIRRFAGANELYDLVADPWEQTDLLRGTLNATQARARDALLAEVSRLRTPRAAVVPYGDPNACRGSNGVPVLVAQGVPVLGTRYKIELRSAAPGTSAALLLGLSMERFRGAPLPIDLSALGGGAGCLIAASGDAWAFAGTDAAGTAALTFNIPAAQPLVGRAVFHTWLVADRSAPGNRLGLVTSGAAASILGL